MLKYCLVQASTKTVLIIKQIIIISTMVTMGNCKFYVLIVEQKKLKTDIFGMMRFYNKLKNLHQQANPSRKTRQKLKGRVSLKTECLRTTGDKINYVNSFSILLKRICTKTKGYLNCPGVDLIARNSLNITKVSLNGDITRAVTMGLERLSIPYSLCPLLNLLKVTMIIINCTHYLCSHWLRAHG